MNGNQIFCKDYIKLSKTRFRNTTFVPPWRTVPWTYLEKFKDPYLPILADEARQKGKQKGSY